MKSFCTHFTQNIQIYTAYKYLLHGPIPNLYDVFETIVSDMTIIAIPIQHIIIAP